MNKEQYYIKACKAQCYKDLPWVISVFSLVQEGPDDWRENPYPYRFVRDATGCFYVNPENVEELLRLEDADAGAPLFEAGDLIELQAGDCPNLKQDLTSSVGNLLFNWVALVYPFGDKIEYVNPEAEVDFGAIKKQILKRFHDDVAPGEQEQPEFIYAREYLLHAEGMFYFTGMTQLFAWAGSQRILVAPPGIKEYRKKLLEENKDSLGETETIAKIDKALIAFDAEYLKGDPSERFLTKKSRQTVRKKLYLMHGAEVSLAANTVKTDIIPTSLSEGLDITRWPQYMDGLRAGSYFRGAETMLGGVSAKELLRASSNINIVKGDCGAKVGFKTLITKANLENYSFFSMVDDKGVTTKFHDAAHVGEYLGQVIQIRDPMYCQATPDFCEVCAGERLSINPDGLSIEIMAYGSVFLTMSLKKMHANVLEVAYMDFRVAIT